MCLWTVSDTGLANHGNSIIIIIIIVDLVFIPDALSRATLLFIQLGFGTRNVKVCACRVQTSCAGVLAQHPAPPGHVTCANT